MLPTDSGVMRHASDQQTRLAMQGNQFSVQTGMNVGSMAGRAIQQGLQVAEFKRRGEVNRSRLATESLRRQELKMRMGQYQEELALRQTRSQTMLMEAQTAREMNALKMEMMEKGEERMSSEAYSQKLNQQPDGTWQVGDVPVSGDEAKNYALRGRRSPSRSQDDMLDLEALRHKNRLVELEKVAELRLVKTGVEGDQDTDLALLKLKSSEKAAEKKSLEQAVKDTIKDRKDALSLNTWWDLPPKEKQGYSDRIRKAQQALDDFKAGQSEQPGTNQGTGKPGKVDVGAMLKMILPEVERLQQEIQSRQGGGKK